MRQQMLASSVSDYRYGEVLFTQDNNETDSGFTIGYNSYADGKLTGIDGDDYRYIACYSTSSSSAAAYQLYFSIWDGATGSAPNAYVIDSLDSGQKYKFIGDLDWYLSSNWTSAGNLDQNAIYMNAYGYTSPGSAATTLHNAQISNYGQGSLASSFGQNYSFEVTNSSYYRIDFTFTFWATYTLSNITSNGKTWPYFGARSKNFRLLKKY